MCLEFGLDTVFLVVSHCVQSHKKKNVITHPDKGLVGRNERPMRGLKSFTKNEQKQNFTERPDLADAAFRFFSTGAAEGGGFPLAFLFSFGLSLFFLSPFFLGGSRLPPDAEKRLFK